MSKTTVKPEHVYTPRLFNKDAATVVVPMLLEMFAVPYVPMASLSMQERVRLMQRVLTLAGVEPLGEATASDDPGGMAVPVTDAAQGNGSRATLS